MQCVELYIWHPQKFRASTQNESAEKKMKNVFEFKLTSNRIIFVFAQLVAEKPCAMQKISTHAQNVRRAKEKQVNKQQ